LEFGIWNLEIGNWNFKFGILNVEYADDKIACMAKN
jgi:hypothetical protein